MRKVYAQCVRSKWKQWTTCFSVSMQIQNKLRHNCWKPYGRNYIWGDTELGGRKPYDRHNMVDQRSRLGQLPEGTGLRESLLLVGVGDSCIS